jgi:hypothetical protein
LNAKFGCDGGAVEFYRTFVDAKVVSDLLVQFSPQDVLFMEVFATRKSQKRKTPAFDS